MSKKLQLSLICVALLSQLNAQEITLAPLEVTSTAIATNELSSTDAVEVYTAEDIEKAHVQNVYEFLNKQTSVFATSAYGNPFLQKLDLRGFGLGDGYQNIVVTINGKKMNNIDMVPQLLSSIAPSSIKSIEIIKSSGVVIGGDGANAGAINIITKESNNAELSFYIGNYGVADGSVYLGHQDDKLSLTFSGETTKNDGIRTVNTQGDKDEKQLTTASLDLKYKATNDLDLLANFATTTTNVVYAGSMTKAEYDQDPTQQGTYFGFPSAEALQSYDSNLIGAGFTYYINNALSLQATISREKKSSDYALPSFASTAQTKYDYITLSTFLEYTNSLLALKAGVESFDADLNYQNSYNVSLDMTKKNEALFISSEYYIDRLTFKAGYRYEKMKFQESAGDHKSENLHGVELGANYLINKESSVFASYSHAYETAQLDRLFSYTNPATGYMGYVKPAISDSYTIGYDNIQKNNKFKLSVYYIDLQDEIYYYADPSYTNSKNTNIDKSHKYGIDLYDKWLISENFNLSLNYNYVQAIIDTEVENGEIFSGNDLPGVSDHNVKITFDYLPNEYTTISLVEVYRSEAYAAEDFHNNFTQKQEAYNTTDISATYAKDNWEVFAKINNLFNQKNGLWIRDNAIYPVNYTTTGFIGFKLKY